MEIGGQFNAYEAGQDAHSVDNIAKLYDDSDFINEQTLEWGKQVNNVYTTIAELKLSWAGSFSRKYTDAVEKVQPDLLKFASDLSILASTLGTVANMYKALEAGNPVGSAVELDANKFYETDAGRASTDKEVTFDPGRCREKAQLLNEAADAIERIIEDVGDRIESINENYSSPKGKELIGTIQKMKNDAPDYVKAIKECADCLINVVAPQYASIENYIDNKAA